MAIVCIILALGLAGAAWFNRRDKWAARFFLACSLLNAGAAAHMIATHYGYAFHLQPNDGASDAYENARPDRR